MAAACLLHDFFTFGVCRHGVFFRITIGKFLDHLAIDTAALQVFGCNVFIRAC